MDLKNAMPKISRLALCLAVAASAASAGAGLALAAGSPFDSLKGAWRGGGVLKLESGQSEKVSCFGYYKNLDGGTGLSVAIRCAGPKNKLELRSKLTYAAGKVSGTWEERTYQGAGNASGTANPGRLNLQFNGSISGSLSIAFSPSRQTVTASVSTAGAGIKGAHFNLSK